MLGLCVVPIVNYTHSAYHLYYKLSAMEMGHVMLARFRKFLRSSTSCTFVLHWFFVYIVVYTIYLMSLFRINMNQHLNAEVRTAYHSSR